MPRAEAGGGRLDALTSTAGMNLVRRGTGSPVVLVHGIGGRWQVFEPIIDELARHHDVVAVDLPGFGASPPRVGGSAHVTDFADDLAHLFAELGLHAPHVVGNSLGGGVALELGRLGLAGQVTAFSPTGFWRRPGRVWCPSVVRVLHAAAVHAGPLLDRGLVWSPTRLALLSLVLGHPERMSLAEAREEVAALAGATGFRETLRAFPKYTFEGSVDPDGLAGIPVTIAWGTRDRLLTHRTQSARARALIPSARHVDLEGCGHLPFQDDPELCARAVLAPIGAQGR